MKTAGAQALSTVRTAATRPRTARRPRVAEQFETAVQQRAAATLGMWVFIATETLFFGALFFAYAIARIQAPDDFAQASRHTNLVLGTANTAILLSSSLFMALSVRAAALGTRQAAVGFLVITAALGLSFTGVKLAEYALDYREHLVPLVDFAFDPRHARGALVFFGLYFATTGLHLVHLSIGIALVLGLAWRLLARRPGASAEHVAIAGLYWHFVDIVWIFLYPCLYLVSRA
ncbi:MAG TPA: cytochrome c oxidase subunit 3 [Casimicrobiaceae bacterium]|nr:cytochrome c oxidase subunit 3 [Casimicrobiaceae bacterium]